MIVPKKPLQPVREIPEKPEVSGMKAIRQIK
jgi:hypothetical protein